MFTTLQRVKRGARDHHPTQHFIQVQGRSADAQYYVKYVFGNLAEMFYMNAQIWEYFEDDPIIPKDFQLWHMKKIIILLTWNPIQATTELYFLIVHTIQINC